MPDYKVTTSELTSIANAIRAKNPTLKTLVYPTGFVSAINDFKIITMTISTTATDIGSQFKNCTSLGYVFLPSNITTGESYAFSGCRSLKTAFLLGMTKLQGYTFYNCTSLELVYLAACTQIENYNFSGCTKLASLYIMTSSVCTITSNSVGHIPSGCKIYVPSSLLSSYKAASNWSTIASQIYSA